MGPDIAANFAQTAANIAQLAALRNAQNPPTVGSAPPKGLAGGGGRTYLGNVNYQSPGTPDTQGFAKAVLERLNAPVNANTMALMMAWFQAEGTSAKWNPMATTLRYGGSHSMPNSSVGVQEYKDMASGVAATVRTLQTPDTRPSSGCCRQVSTRSNCSDKRRRSSIHGVAATEVTMA